MTAIVGRDDKPHPPITTVQIGKPAITATPDQAIPPGIGRGGRKAMRRKDVLPIVPDQVPPAIARDKHCAAVQAAQIAAKYE